VSNPSNPCSIDITPVDIPDIDIPPINIPPESKPPTTNPNAHFYLEITHLHPPFPNKYMEIISRQNSAKVFCAKQTVFEEDSNAI
jgi:hypothetical protein